MVALIELLFFFKKNIRSIVRCCLKRCVVIKILSVVLSKKIPHPSPPSTFCLGVGRIRRGGSRRSTKKGGWIEFALSLLRDQRNCSSEGGWLGKKEEGGWWVHHSMFNPLQSPPPFEKKCWREFCCGILLARFLGTAGAGLVSAFLYSVFAFPSPSEKPGQRAFFSFFPSTFSPSIQPQACGDFKLPSRSRISGLKIGLFLLWWMRYGQIPIHFFSSTKYPLFWEGNKCIFFLEKLSCKNTFNSCLSKAPLSPTSTKFPNLYSLFGDEGQAKHIPLPSILDQRRRGCQTLTSSSQPPLFPPSWRKFQQTRDFLFIAFPRIWDPRCDCKAYLKEVELSIIYGESGNQSASQPVPFLYRGRKEGGGPKGNRHRGEERREKTEEEPRTKFWIFQVSSPPPLLLPWGKGGSRRREGKKEKYSLSIRSNLPPGRVKKCTKSSEILLFSFSAKWLFFAKKVSFCNLMILAIWIGKLTIAEPEIGESWGPNFKRSKRLFSETSHSEENRFRLF